jgi:fibronectin type III domain protein
VNARSTDLPTDTASESRDLPPDLTERFREILREQPESVIGRARRRAFERAALSEARALRRQAGRAEAAVARELRQRANRLFFLAVAARNLGAGNGKALASTAADALTPTPATFDHTELQHIDAALATATATFAATAAPPGPTNARAVVTSPNSALVSWTAPTAPPAGLVLQSFLVTPLGGSGLTPLSAILTATSLPFPGLIPGTTYRFEVKALYAQGLSTVESLPAYTNNITPGLFTPQFPTHAPDPLLVLDAASHSWRGLINAASETGGRWRFQHLREQALKAATDALAYESHIAQMMAMNVAKVETAQQLLTPVLLDAINKLQGSAQGTTMLTSSTAVADAERAIGQSAAEAMFLEALINWLLTTSPTQFWIGLFDALIDDIAAFDTSLSRTGAYLDFAFSSSLATSLQPLLEQIRTQVDGEVNAIAGPLREAVAELIGGASSALQEVFQSFDEPLVMAPASGARPDTPNMDPLAGLSQQVRQSVENLIAGVKFQIDRTIAEAIGGSSALFRAVVIGYLVLPALASLVVAIAGGPISAALLAGVIMIAAEELIRLITGWLAGPLRKEIDQARARLEENVTRLRQIFADQAALISTSSPDTALRLLSWQLRELKDFLPEAFLDQTAEVLSAARNVVVENAVKLALGAEQALGNESGSAFDAVSYHYETDLAQAPQLAGGADPQRLSAAALLRDIGSLQQQATALHDSKEIELTHRLSLRRLLGGDPTDPTNPGLFAQFLQQGQVVVQLQEAALLDQRTPGLYRALIKEVSVSGIFDQVPADPSLSMPIVLTHLGRSATRIRKDANPAAPPVTPPCMPTTADLLVAELFAGERGHAAAEAAVRWMVIRPRADFWMLPGFSWIANGLVDAASACGNANVSGLRSQAISLYLAAKWWQRSTLLPSWSSTFTYTEAQIDQAIADILNFFKTGKIGGATIGPGLEGSVRTVYETYAGRFRPHIAKWAGATWEEDPDEQVRALGFVRLVRVQKPETAVFNLFPLDVGMTTTTLSATPVALDAAPITIQTLQYPPFANRGLEGEVLINLPTLGNGAVAGAGVPDALSGTASSLLKDIVLNVTVRACYDPDLAATVRASRSQTAGALRVADTLGGSRVLSLAGTRIELFTETRDARTVRFSLRAHRERTLRAWFAAVEEYKLLNGGALPPWTLPGSTTSLASVVAGKKPLARDDPFAPLQGTLAQLVVDFRRRPTTPAAADLGRLATTISIAPEDLDAPLGLLSPGGPSIAEPAELLGVTIAIIPMRAGVRKTSAPGSTAWHTGDPLAIQLGVDPLFAPILPFTTAAPLGRRLVYSQPPGATQTFPALKDLWPTTGNPALRIDFGANVFDPVNPSRNLVYDVVIGLTFRAPALEVSTV